MKEVNEPLMASFDEVRAAFSATANGNRRGDFATMASGISHGGGQKVRSLTMVLARILIMHYRGPAIYRTAARGPAPLRKRSFAILRCRGSPDLEMVRSPCSAIAALPDAFAQLRSSSSYPDSISSTAQPLTPSVLTIPTSSATLRRSFLRP